MFNMSEEIILDFELSLAAKVLPDFIILLVHSQSVTVEESTVIGVVGTQAVFRWTVDRNGETLSVLSIFQGTEFNLSRILFLYSVGGQRFDPSLLETNYFEGRLNAALTGDVTKGPKFNCTVTLNDLQLHDSDEQFFLYAGFVGGVERGNVITLKVEGIYWFVPFFAGVVFYHERHDVRPFM